MKSSSCSNVTAFFMYAVFRGLLLFSDAELNRELNRKTTWHMPEQAVERVATRVSEGGHNIPSDVIRRRYANGLHNLTMLYTPICDYWTIYDNSSADGIHKVAWGVKNEIKEVSDTLSYKTITDYERD